MLKAAYNGLSRWYGLIVELLFMSEDLFGDNYLIQEVFDQLKTVNQSLLSSLLHLSDGLEFNTLKPIHGDINPLIQIDEYPHLRQTPNASDAIKCIFDSYYDAQSPDQVRTLKYPGYIIVPTSLKPLIDAVNQTRKRTQNFIKQINNASKNVGDIQAADGWYVRQSGLRALFDKMGHRGLHLHQAFRQIQTLECSQVRLALYLKKKPSLTKTSVYDELKRCDEKLSNEPHNQQLLFFKDKLMAYPGQTPIAIVKKTAYNPTVNIRCDNPTAKQQLSNVLPIVILSDDPVTVQWSCESFINPKPRQQRSTRVLQPTPLIEGSSYYLYQDTA
jgi:hypothetical protein